MNATITKTADGQTITVPHARKVPELDPVIQALLARWATSYGILSAPDQGSATRAAVPYRYLLAGMPDASAPLNFFYDADGDPTEGTLDIKSDAVVLTIEPALADSAPTRESWLADELEQAIALPAGAAPASPTNPTATTPPTDATTPPEGSSAKAARPTGEGLLARLAARARASTWLERGLLGGSLLGFVTSAILLRKRKD